MYKSVELINFFPEGKMVDSRKYSLDESVFENIDSEEKAYWLGFILADGSIFNNRLKIGLAIKDINHLEKFKKFLNSSNKIYCYKVGNGANNKKSECCEIVITNKKIVEDLGKLGIGPNKTHTVEIPQIKEELMSHLIRGIWDGDGSVLFRTKNKKYSNNFRPEVQICGNFKVVSKINEILSSKLELKLSKLSKVSSIYLFRKETRSAKKVVEYLYKNSNIYLDRKYEKAVLGMNWIPRKSEILQ